MSINKADILIVTVTEVETRAVLEAFNKETQQKSKPVPIGDRIYQDLGEVNGSHAFLAISDMGSSGLGGAQKSVDKGIEALSPSAVIMIGIAFGVNEQKQTIGDILVSTQLLLYEIQRVGKEITPRGDKPHASMKLIDLFKSANVYWGDAKAKVRFGLVLTGEKLVDNIDYREQLKKFEPEAIGGEMEGMGLYVACQDKNVDWILVKGICDWADGNKGGPNKEKNQTTAANNATTFVLHALQHAPFKRDCEHYFNFTQKPPRRNVDYGFFDSPVVRDAVQRPNLIVALETALREQPVVVLGGMSGSGKTYLMSSYIAERIHSSTYQRVLWYDAQKGETLDNLLALLDADFSLSGLSTVTRCKTLLAFIREKKLLLVIDNYHTVDYSSYSLLVDVFSHAGVPCRLVLLSQVYVALPNTSRDPHQIPISGFSSEETKNFLRSRGLQGLPDNIVEDLMDKTAALPFAVNLFALLVREFGWEPVALLSGAMENGTRIRTWFNCVISLIDANSRKLLPYLSLDDTPFNIGIVRLLSRHAGLTDSDIAFEQLQRCYLVGKHSLYRWKVHDLIANLARPLLELKEREQAFSLLGHHYLHGLPRRRDSLLTEKQFIWKVRAFRYLRRSSNDSDLARIVLKELAGTAKMRGHYSLFIKLSSDFLANTDPDHWLAYNHAHCALILGLPEYCRSIIEPLLLDKHVVAIPTKHLSFTRLYAEALGSMHQEAVAIETLTVALNVTECGLVGTVALAQARSVLVWLLTRIGRYKEALQLCEELLADAVLRNDERGGAVAWAHLGVIKLRSGNANEAQGALTQAAELFKKVGDRRGEAWCLTNCSECFLIKRNEMSAIMSFKIASGIASDIGECGIDYRESLSRMNTMATQEQLILLIAEEIKRVELTAVQNSNSLKLQD